MVNTEVRIHGRSWSKQPSMGKVPEHETLRETDEFSFKGLWRSEGGSLYSCDGRSFLCISVHSSEFGGWVGKVAVRDIHQSGDTWWGWQAFRNPGTGALGGWSRIRLAIALNTVTKYLSSGAGRLVYGPVEHYYRVALN